MSPRPPIPLLALAALLLAGAGGAALVAGRPASRAGHSSATATRLPVDARQRGVCFVAGPDAPSEADFTDLAAHGVTWISQTPFGWQARHDEPTFRMITDRGIYWGERDSGLVFTARRARAHGIRTLLKPHVWLRDRSDGKWVGSIAMKNEADWAAWFARYEEFIVHYARLAEASGMEALALGTELEGTTRREADWRRIIAAVRRVYPGRLTYAANWSGEFEQVKFWDALDFIGVQAYFPLSNRPEATVDELVAGWAPHVAKLEALHRATGKPIVLTEIGYKAADRATVEPWTWTTTDRYNPDEQARAYEAAYRALWAKPWCDGFYWWKWFPAGHHEAGGRDFYFTPQGKPAALVLRRIYTAGSRAGGRVPVRGSARGK